MTDKIVRLHKNKQITPEEVLKTFLKQVPKDQRGDYTVVNACVIYQTADGFAHNMLNYDGIMGMIGALECAKAYFLTILLQSGEIEYTEGDDDD